MKVLVNNKKYLVNKPQTILDFCRSIDIVIPTLCHVENLGSYASCFLCTVELKDRGLVPACSTVLLDGMTIETDSEKVLASRKTALELLLSEHTGDCYSPCSVAGCPANIDIQGFLKLEAEGNYTEAAKLIREKAPLPNVLGWVCPKPCEEKCRRNRVDDPVRIGIQKRFIAEHEIKLGGYFLPKIKIKSDKKVAIIGAGPAGITAAYYLKQAGHQVEIFEKNEQHGGMLRYGIPDYRLPQSVLNKEFDSIINTYKISVHYQQELGKNLKLDSVLSKFDAVLLSIGSWKYQKMNIIGEDCSRVYSGIDFLKKIAENNLVSLGKKITVIGGGNTALDSARTALRLGSKVTVLYRRTENEMPSNKQEIEEAKEEGIKFDFLTTPVKYIETEQGINVHCVKMELGEPDSSGRRRPVHVVGSDFIIQVDQVIMAIGQYTDYSFLDSNQLSKRGYLNYIPKTYQTIFNENVFLAGDCTTGPSLVVNAVRDGRKAAISIGQYLAGQEVKGDPDRFSSVMGELNDLPEKMFKDYKKTARTESSLLPLKERQKTFKHIELSETEDNIKTEALRCLQCGCDVVETCLLKKYAEKYNADQFFYSGNKKEYQKDNSHSLIHLETNKCISCGACVRVCDEIKKFSLLGYTGRGFSSRIKPEFQHFLRDTTCDACGKCVDVCPTAGIHYL